MPRADHCLIADIGGTNARFALARCLETPAIERQWLLATRDYAGPLEAVRTLLADVPPSLRPTSALLAIAAPVTGDAVCMTNAGWSFSIAALKAALALRQLWVINDFEAAGWAVPTLGSADVLSVGAPIFQPMRPGERRLLMGPGTGLGVAAVHSTAGGFAVSATQGGHVGLAPTTAEDAALLARLGGRVIAEQLLSGPGLVTLHRLMTGQNAANPAAICAAAAAGAAAEQRTLACFYRLLGSFAGDAVLMHGAWAGVVLTGGVMAADACPEHLEHLRAGFEDKGASTGLLASVPLAVARDSLGLKGAGARAAQLSTLSFRSS